MHGLFEAPTQNARCSARAHPKIARRAKGSRSWANQTLDPAASVAGCPRRRLPRPTCRRPCGHLLTVLPKNDRRAASKLLSVKFLARRTEPHRDELAAPWLFEFVSVELERPRLSQRMARGRGGSLLVVLVSWSSSSSLSSSVLLRCLSDCHPPSSPRLAPLSPPLCVVGTEAILWRIRSLYPPPRTRSHTHAPTRARAHACSLTLVRMFARFCFHVSLFCPTCATGLLLC